MATYTVQKGDNLTQIAKKYNTTIDAIASANNIKDKNLINTGAVLTIPGTSSSTSSNTSNTVPASASLNSNSNSNNTNLAGVSQNTQNQMNKYSGAYQQSGAVTAAQNYLNSVLSQKPGEFSSQYSATMSDLMNQINNRDPFKYDINSDMLYQQAKDQYTALGKQAMQDTMGQAAAMTGGYGNSYASTAGNQAYQNYLTQLNNNLPEYYQMAKGTYDDETESLYNKFNLAQTGYNNDYGLYRDTVSDWQGDRDYATNQYNSEKNLDYSDWNSLRSYFQNQAQLENGNYWDQTNYDEGVRQYNENLAYQKQQDAIAQSQWEQEMAYQKEQDAISNARAAATSSKATNYSGITDSQLKQVELYGNSGNNEKLDTYLQSLVESNVISDATAYELYKQHAKYSTQSATQKAVSPALNTAVSKRPTTFPSRK